MDNNTSNTVEYREYLDGQCWKYTTYDLKNINIDNSSAREILALQKILDLKSVCGNFHGYKSELKYLTDDFVFSKNKTLYLGSHEVKAGCTRGTYHHNEGSYQKIIKVTNNEVILVSSYTSLSFEYDRSFKTKINSLGLRPEYGYPLSHIYNSAKYLQINEPNIFFSSDQKTVIVEYSAYGNTTKKVIETKLAEIQIEII